MPRTKSEKADTATDGAIPSALLKALEPFVDLRARIVSVNFVRSFLAVAANEGQSVNTHAHTLGLPQSTMSRNLLDLSKRDRNMNDGPQLVEGIRNPQNLHETLYYLTSKGKALLAEMKDAKQAA